MAACLVKAAVKQRTRGGLWTWVLPFRRTCPRCCASPWNVCGKLSPAQHSAQAFLLARALVSPGSSVRFREVDRQILCGSADAPVADSQRYVLVELKAQAADGSVRTQAQRERFYPSWDALLADEMGLRQEMEAAAQVASQKLRAQPLERSLTSVFCRRERMRRCSFTSCAVIRWRETSGPGCSYLGALQGQRVASEFVSVVDDPCSPEAGLRYAFDDEGHPAQKVSLLEDGVVRGTLWSEEEAQASGAVPNGHGRRTDYRYPAISRMSHTAALLPHRGTLEELMAPVESGLLVHFLTPRHVDILRGDFSFYVVEAQRIERGKAGAWIAPAILRGNGLTTLRNIDAVGHDSKTFFGLKGCGSWTMALCLCPSGKSCRRALPLCRWNRGVKSRAMGQRHSDRARQRQAFLSRCGWEFRLSSARALRSLPIQDASPRVRDKMRMSGQRECLRRCQDRRA